MLTALLERARTVRSAEMEGDEAVDAGFTLIELMVVLLIMGILMAIAIPTFLGVTGSANDRAAQSNLTNAITEASAVFQANNQSFTNLTPTVFQSSAPEFSWTTGSAAPGNNISIDISSDGGVLILASASKAGSGTCWYAMYAPEEAPSTAFPSVTGMPSTAGTFYAKGAATSGACTASNAASFGSWFSSYGAATVTN